MPEFHGSRALSSVTSVKCLNVAAHFLKSHFAPPLHCIGTSLFFVSFVPVLLNLGSLPDSEDSSKRSFLVWNSVLEEGLAG
jgi:hypothetical protein